jgi:hypothetical protein
MSIKKCEECGVYSEGQFCDVCGNNLFISVESGDYDDSGDYEEEQ